MKKHPLYLILGLLLAPSVLFGDATLWREWAKTPPMGWNSYDCFGAAVYESEVKANADVMAERLKKFGWEYIVVDYCWSYPHPPGNGQDNPPQFELPRGGLVPWLEMDEYGRLLPTPMKFPSCTPEVGFKPLADYVHSLGLKFGIHVMRGIPKQAVLAKTPVLGTEGIDASMIADTSSTCPWLNQMYGLDMSKPGAQEYLNSLLDLYASWDVDYIKVDDIHTTHAGDLRYSAAEVEGYRKAIDQCGRPIVLSLSPKIVHESSAGHVENYANLWRISADFWDRWDKLKEMFDLVEQWNEYRTPGSWPDNDMIPFGKLRRRGPFGEESQSQFTLDEHRTLMSLWCITRSPLMFGGDLAVLDEFTESIITNEEVLQANIEGSDPKLFYREGNQVVWLSNHGDDAKFLALFNLGEEAEVIEIKISDLGMKKPKRMRDLWHQKKVRVGDILSVKIPPHGAAMYKVE